MGSVIHRIDEINGVIEKSSTTPYVGRQIIYKKEDTRVINQGAEYAFRFEYRTAKEAEKDKEKIDSILIMTDRGDYYLPIRSFKEWKTRTGTLGYSAISTTQIGKWKNELHCWWWSKCLKNPDTKRRFMKRDRRI